MRTVQRLPKTVTAAVLGALLLTAGGTGTASAATPADQVAARAAAKAKAARALVKPPVAKPPAKAPWGAPTEARFRMWAGNIVDTCLPSRPQGTSPTAVTGTTVDEVPLGLIEQCVGGHHHQRITQAFPTGPADYPRLRAQLLALGYPAERIHRIQGHHGSPVARIDLRLGRFGGDVAVDVTGYRTMVTAEPFGVPGSFEVKVTDVRRKPVIDRPQS
ncbi:hypothetical protein [Streptomyces sp. NPDC085479]|uniref:hypothetical protein n=1 Tax=Streptomyces sp. NPDC085479 TaxID=3365726 RepID=UPI0037D57504